MKKTVFSYEQINEICKKYPTPFYLYDEAEIRRRVKALYKAFSWNKGFKEYYAVKACPNPEIINILKSEGCGVDCSSYTELMLAEVLNLSGNEIMFSSNVTPAEDFKYARKLASIINLDDITHIDFLEKNGSLPKQICLRYNPGGDMKDGNRIMGTPGEAKYGFTRHQLTEGVRILMSKGVASFGLHAFLASNSLDKDYYPKLAGMLFETAVEIHNETGASIDFINLSGGIGIPYLPEEEEIDLEYIGREVEKIYNNVILSSGLGDIELKTELGRFITGPAGYLITHAIHEKHTYKEYIGLDACAANLMRPAMYGAYHHITVMGKETCPADHIYDITGGLCENNDKFAVDRKLPKIDMGDIVVLHDTGAHSFSMGYNYNGKLRSAELLLSSDSSVKLIRRAETPSDYFATLDFTGLFDKILKINFSKQYIDK